MYTRRTLLRFAFLTLFAGQPLVVPLFAQSNACPPSDLAQTNPSAAQDDAGLKEIVDTVEFRGDNPLAEAQQAKLTKQIKELPLPETPVATDGDWVEYASVAVREELQNTGYFKAIVSPKPFLIRAEKLELHYALRLDIEGGPQYRLGNVQFEGADPDTALNFDASILRQQFELQGGDIFDVSKIRSGLDRLSEGYRSQGYIDMVPTPETQLHDTDSRIDLTIKIQEGSPYRIARIEVFIVAEQKAHDLQLPQSAGEIINPTLWSKFFEDNQAQLRSTDPDRVMQIKRNVANHTVSLTVDFRPCSQDRPVIVLHSRDADLESPVAGSQDNKLPRPKTRIESLPNNPEP